MADYEIFNLGDVELQNGATLPDAKLAYKTYGTLNSSKTNAILYPVPFGTGHSVIEGMINPEMALDPRKYFIIIPNLFGNGLSSSPSNTPPPYDRGRFPNITVYDNVLCQHRLVTEKFGIDKLELVTGWSMGALQTFQWGATFSEMVPKILPWCGSAKTSTHNKVFLEGLRAALTADDAWNNGWYEQQPTKGIRAMARVYAGWGFSQTFYREGTYLDLGYSSLEDFLVRFWEGRRLASDANDLLAMIWTWFHADISANNKYNGNFEEALRSIKSRAIVMPSKTDLYFPPEDSEYEVKHMPNAELRIVPTIWGHLVGPGTDPKDTKFLDDSIRYILSE